MRYSFQASEIDCPYDMLYMCVRVVSVFLSVSASPDSLARSSLHAALRARYGIGDDDLLHQVAIGFEADGLPGLGGEWVELPSQEEISGLNLINTLHAARRNRIGNRK